MELEPDLCHERKHRVDPSPIFFVPKLTELTNVIKAMLNLNQSICDMIVIFAMYYFESYVIQMIKSNCDHTCVLKRLHFLCKYLCAMRMLIYSVLFRSKMHTVEHSPRGTSL